jgi:cytochrome c
MDNFEMTKIAGAVLAALLLIMGTKVFVEERSEKTAAKTGYSLPGTEPPAAEAKADAKVAPAAKAEGAAPAEKKTAEAPKADAPKAEAPKTEAPKEAAAAPAKPDAAPAKADAAPAAAAAGAGITALLAKASADNGKAIFGKCKSCHIAESGKTSTVGPNLWGVVNRAKGTLAGYPNYSEGMKGKGGNWSFDDLSAFLTNPKAYVTGTKMGFAGLAEASDRADVIAYLATLADAPVALPK